MAIKASIHIHREINRIISEGCDFDEITSIITQSKSEAEAAGTLIDRVLSEMKKIFESKEFKLAFSEKNIFEREKAKYESNAIDAIEKRMEFEWKKAMELKKVNENLKNPTVKRKFRTTKTVNRLRTEDASQ